MAEFFSTYLNQFTYSGLVAALICTGIGLPFPESIILIIGGFMAYSGRTDLYYTGLACYGGVLTGDMISYHMGRRWGDKIIHKTTVSGVLTNEKWKKVKKHFAKHEGKTIFFSRFIPGIRVAAHIMAGILKVRTLKFFFINSTAALINVPLTVYVGYIFGSRMEKILYVIRGLSIFLVTIVSAGAGVGVIYYLVKRKRAQQNFPS